MHEPVSVPPRATRRALLAAAAALFPAALARRAGAQPVLPTVTYGLTSKTANDWVNFLANKLGFFTANGVSIDYVTVGSAAGNAQQLTAGSLNLGGVASPNLIEAVIGGAPLVTVLARNQASPRYRRQERLQLDQRAQRQDDHRRRAQRDHATDG